MKSHTTKARVEILIGEAALALFDEKASVSWTGILRKLEAQLSAEHDESRVEVFKMAIEDIRTEINRRGSDRDSDNEVQSATASEDSDRTSRH